MRSNLEWQEWGEKDPLFGVASWAGRKRSGTRPWTDEEFYALGEDWRDFKGYWERYGLSYGTALEVGCGAGRITNRLAKDFAHVIACDVSAGMLNYAKERVVAPNISWMHTDGTSLPAPDDSIDAVFSCHVLQHMENNAAQLRCLLEVYRVLRPGGTFLIHMMLHRFPEPNRSYSKIARSMYKCFSAIAGYKAWLRRKALRYGGPGYMHGVSYEIDQLRKDTLAIGFSRIEVAMFPVRSNDGWHTVVLGTKPSATGLVKDGLQGLISTGPNDG